MKYLSTFSGIGGFEKGIQLAYEIRNADGSENGGIQKNTEGNQRQRFQPAQGKETSTEERPASQRDNDITDQRPLCIGYSEIDKYASSIYQSHFPNHKNYGDITKIQWESVPDFDLFVGGFPCQAFSIAGKRKGFEDTRGTLFFDVAKGLQVKQPSFAVFENVKGLLSHDKGRTLETILETLQELGYYVNIEVYNSKDYGVPQNRERIIFICKHIKGLISVGQSKKMNTYDRTIQEYLFQLLLTNLTEVQKLQEHASKDLILACLLLKEIKENLPNHDISESIMGGTLTLTVENVSQLKVEEVWQNIDMCLKNIWVYDSNQLSKYTTSTAIKQIIDSKTYTYSRMFQAISLATVQLRNSSKDLWNEMLSDLIVIKENTKYARINDETEEIVVSETGNAYLAKDVQKDGQFIAFGHLRGTRRPEVFPFGDNPEAVTQLSGQHSNTLTTRYYGGQANGTYVLEGKQYAQIPEATKQGYAIAHEGDSINLSVPNSKTRRGRVGHSIAQTLDTGMQQHTLQNSRIRRLTPTECERLQGFPDGWTEGVSDTQRYKTLGNAVTVNVIKDIFEKIL